MWYCICAHHLYPSHSWRATPKLHGLVTREHSVYHPYEEGRPAPSLYFVCHSLKSIAIIEIALNNKLHGTKIPAKVKLYLSSAFSLNSLLGMTLATTSSIPVEQDVSVIYRC